MKKTILILIITFSITLGLKAQTGNDSLFSKSNSEYVILTYSKGLGSSLEAFYEWGSEDLEKKLNIDNISDRYGCLFISFKYFNTKKYKLLTSSSYRKNSGADVWEYIFIKE